MIVTVHRLRAAGEPRPERDIASEAPTRGLFTLVMVEGVAVAKISSAEGNGNMDPIIPELYRAKLMTAHGSGFYFRGFEQGKNGQLIPQEWNVRILSL